MKVIRYAHGEKDFWQIMGPCFASAEIRRHLGVPLTSDEGYVWFLAMNGVELSGFAAVKAQKNGICEFKHAYIFGDYRKNGLYTKLLKARLDYAKEIGCTTCKATVAPALRESTSPPGSPRYKTQG